MILTENDSSMNNRQNIPMDLEEKGQMTIKFLDTDNAKHSPHNNYLHVKSATGYNNPGFQTEITFQNVQKRKRTTKYYLRCYLTRSNSEARHIPVDKVCEKHLPQGDTMPNHVLRHGDDNPDILDAEYIDGTQPSIRFQLRPPEKDNNHSNVIRITVRMYMMCFDSCRNMQNPDPKTPTKYIVRDLQMVQTLEVQEHGDWNTTHQRTWPIWPKAVICKRELHINPRRGPQGGLAYKMKQDEDRQPRPTKGTKKRQKHYLDQLGTGTWKVNHDWVKKFFELEGEGEATLTLTRNLATGQTNAIFKASYPNQ